MLFDSALITAASGSLGGITAGHNRGGLYLRARVTPTDPNTVRQQTVRANMAFFVDRWNSYLTQVQRDSWELYAKNVPLVNRLGQVRPVTALNHYLRSNLPRFQAAIISTPDQAPDEFSLGQLTPPPDFQAKGLLNKLHVFFDETDPWVTRNFAGLIVWGGRPVNPGVKFFAGPYRFAGKLIGDNISPPSSPIIVTSAYSISVGQRVFVRVRVTEGDGRLSHAIQLTALVT